MRWSGIIGIGAAAALIVIAIEMGGMGAFVISVAGMAFCVGLTLAIGIASFGAVDLFRALNALRALFVPLEPEMIAPRDIVVIRGIIPPLYAAGMMGTLIGMVQMLATLGSPSHLGAGTAVALLTILYALIGAELVLRPASRLMIDIADKLESERAEDSQ